MTDIQSGHKTVQKSKPSEEMQSSTSKSQSGTDGTGGRNVVLEKKTYACPNCIKVFEREGDFTLHHAVRHSKLGPPPKVTPIIKIISKPLPATNQTKQIPQSAHRKLKRSRMLKSNYKIKEESSDDTSSTSDSSDSEDSGSDRRRQSRKKHRRKSKKHGKSNNDETSSSSDESDTDSSSDDSGIKSLMLVVLSSSKARRMLTKLLRMIEEKKKKRKLKRLQRYKLQREQARNKRKCKTSGCKNDCRMCRKRFARNYFKKHLKDQSGNDIDSDDTSSDSESSSSDSETRKCSKKHGDKQAIKIIKAKDHLGKRRHENPENDKQRPKPVPREEKSDVANPKT